MRMHEASTSTNETQTQARVASALLADRTALQNQVKSSTIKTITIAPRPVHVSPSSIHSPRCIHVCLLQYTMIVQCNRTVCLCCDIILRCHQRLDVGLLVEIGQDILQRMRCALLHIPSLENRFFPQIVN